MAGINLGALAYDLELRKWSWEQDIARAKNDIHEIERAFHESGKRISDIGAGLTKSITVPLTGVTVAAVKTGMDFDSQMSRVQAIAGASGEQLKALRDQALQLGADTSFSAAKAAEGMENLASAGFTVNEMMEAMPGLLDMAAASGAELGVASDIAASILRGFSMQASEAGHVADVLAEAAARTNAQVEDMGDAMKYIAPVANAMGLSMESTAAAVGILSNAGIKGSQAGTTLRGALARLTKPTSLMKGVMDELNLSFYDSEGRMKDLSEIIQMLQTSFSDLSEQEQQNAITTLFGQESMSGMLALIDAGPEQLDALTQGLIDSDGAAKNMAETMLDNLGGALEELSGSLETAGIGLYDLGKDHIKTAIQSITDLVNAFHSMDDETKKQILSVAGAAAAMGPLLIVTGKLTSGFSGLIPVLGTASGYLSSFAGSVGATANGLMQNVLKIGGIGEKISGPFKMLGERISGSLGPLKKFMSFLSPLKNLMGPLNSGLGVFGKLVGRLFGAGGIVAIALTLLTALASGASAAGINVENMITNVVEGVTKFAENFAVKFQELAPKVLEAVPSMLRAITDGILSMLDVLLPIGMQMIVMIIQGLAQNINQIITSAIDIVLTLVDALVDAAPMLIEAAFQLIIGIVEGLIDNADRVIDAAIRILQVLIDSLVENLPIIIEKLPDIIMKIVEALIDNAPLLIEAGIQMTIGLAKGLIQAVPELLKAVVELGRRLLDKIKGFFGIRSPSSVLSDIGRNLIQGLINGISNMIGSVVNSVSQIGKRIKEGIGDTISKAKEWGSDLITNISNGIRKAKGVISSAVKSISSAVSSGVKGLLGSARSWGSDMMSGLASGIRSMTTKVANAARNVASRISSFLHFSKPDEGPLSEYEKWMPHMLQGMALGIRRNMDELLRETDSLASKMADNLQPEIDVNATADRHTKGYESVISAISESEKAHPGVLSSQYYTGLFEAVRDGFRAGYEAFNDRDGDIIVNVYEDNILTRTLRQSKRKNIRAGRPVLPVGV